MLLARHWGQWQGLPCPGVLVIRKALVQEIPGQSQIATMQLTIKEKNEKNATAKVYSSTSLLRDSQITPVNFSRLKRIEEATAIYILSKKKKSSSCLQFKSKISIANLIA